MKIFPFKFSIVMALYNVEPFVDMAIRSVLQQSIGFKRNVQLILVNDGSTDNTGEICKRYQQLYPKNIYLIEKPNGGVSSARNMGLSYVRGEYINFMDGDDRLSRNALKIVYKTLKQWDNIEIATIPVYFFDGAQGAHRLNNKFNQGTRIIRVLNEYQYPLLFINATFVSYNIARKLKFDERLTIAEDAKAVLSILLRTYSYGVIKGPVYWYRKRTFGAYSAIQKSHQSKQWYLHYMHFFAEWALEESKDKLGYIPQFVQYTLLFDLHWRYEIPELPDFLLEEEKKEYLSCFSIIMHEIDSDLILSQNMIRSEHKMFMLYQKYQYLPFLKKDKCEIQFEYDGQTIYTHSQLQINIEKVQFRQNDVVFVISYMDYGLFLNRPIVWNLEIGQTVLRFEKIPEEYAVYSMGVQIARNKFYKVVVPWKDGECCQMAISSSVDGVTVRHTKVGLGSRAFVSGILDFWYYCEKGRAILRQEEGLFLEPYGFVKYLKCEIKFVDILRKLHTSSAKKAVLLRGAYFVQDYIRRRKICLLLTDRLPAKPLDFLKERKEDRYIITEHSGQALTPNLQKRIVNRNEKKKVKWLYLCSQKLYLVDSWNNKLFLPLGSNSLFYNDIILKKEIISIGGQ